MFRPVDVVDVAPAAPIVATTAEDGGRVVVVVVIVSRVRVGAWYQGKHVEEGMRAHLDRYVPVRVLVVEGTVEGKAVFSAKRVVEESEGQRPEVTSYGSQVIEESINLLKERLHTTMHCIEEAWREYGGYIREKVEEDLRHASPTAIVKVFVCIITDPAAVDTQPEFHC